MRYHKDDHGVSAIVGFIIAIVLFTVSFYYVVDSSVQREANTSPAEAANFHQLAAGVAGQIFEKGVGWYSANPCLVGAVIDGDPIGATNAAGEPIGRFGLGDEHCDTTTGPSDPGRSNNLSYSKFANINSAKMSANPTNNFADYEEAHRSLGLVGRGLDFHVRSEPVLASVKQILGTAQKDPFLKPLYLGNYVPGSDDTPIVRPTITTSGSFAIDGSGEFGVLSVLISNTGSVTSGFSVDFSVLLEDKPIVFTVNSYPIAGGSSATVSATLRKSDDWSWPDVSTSNPDPQKFTYVVSDSIGPLPGASGSAPMTAAMDYPGNGPENEITTLSMDRRNYGTPFSASNKWPKAKYAAYDGEGNGINNFGNQAGDVEMLIFKSGTATPVATIADPTSSQSLESALEGAVNDEIPDTGLGQYRVELWVPDSSTGLLHSTAYFEIVGASTECNIDPGDFVPASSVITESVYVDMVFDAYDHGASDARFSHATLPDVPGGDVFPDVKCAMNNDLPRFLEDANGNPTLATYTTLIVGSDVDHNVMTSDAAKGTIRDWVFAGGTLIVFGSSQQSVQWLQPIFHAALDSGSTSLYTPDPDHPALNVPNELDYTTFDALTDWDYNSGSDAYFSHVVSAGDDDVLGISNSGSFGSGKVILSGWRPYSIQASQPAHCSTAPTAECQGLGLLHNLVVLSYRNLYLDYGPSVPLFASNGVQTRIASVYHPDLKQLVTVYIQVYVFESAR